LVFGIKRKTVKRGLFLGFLRRLCNGCLDAIRDDITGKISNCVKEYAKSLNLELFVSFVGFVMRIGLRVRSLLIGFLGVYYS